MSRSRGSGSKPSSAPHGLGSGLLELGQEVAMQPQSQGCGQSEEPAQQGSSVRQDTATLPASARTPRRGQPLQRPLHLSQAKSPPPTQLLPRQVQSTGRNKVPAEGQGWA